MSLKTFTRNTRSYQKKKDIINKYTDKLNDIIDDLRDKIEEETKIRKIFENKLNDLHSIVRDKTAGYNRAKIDLDHLLQDNIDKNAQLEKLQEEFKDVSKLKMAYQIKFDSVNNILSNTAKDLNTEKLARHKEVNDLNRNITKTKTQLMDTQMQLNDLSALYEDVNSKYIIFSKLYEKEKSEKERLNNLIGSAKDVSKFEKTIEGLKKE